jgi:hypothetical protein
MLFGVDQLTTGPDGVDLPAEKRLVPNGALYTPHPELVDPAIRRSILYFDAIEWPNVSMTAWPFGSTYDVLLEQQFIQRTSLPLVAAMPPSVGDTIGGMHMEIFRQLEAQQPGVWSYAPLIRAPDSMVHLFPEYAGPIQSRGIECQLYGLLPVPAPEVSYADILDFKERRRPELLALRAHLDDLYLEVARSNDVPRARIVVMAKLEKAVSDLRSAMRGSGFRGVMGSVGVDVMLDAAADYSLGWWAAERIGHSEYTAGLGTLIAGYRFLRKNLRWPISRAGALAYIAHAERELRPSPQ